MKAGEVYTLLKANESKVYLTKSNPNYDDKL